MIKKIALCLLLSPALALAETIPPGCYVADYYRLDPCWSAASGFYEWSTFTSTAGTPTSYYGEAVATIIKNNTIATYDKNSCQASYGTLADAYSQLDAAHVNDYNLLVAKFNTLIDSSDAANKRSSGLVRRLRKACGSKCSRIR